ncbi:thiol reductant ABC exporter subunit CydD [Sanguibacter suaedae]|uniref:Thiol reductant ABC exporter subunit CydD n=1 Tax=Sanguibacter suaedae TaxID=2795737 RepID=A0A934M9A5_9MICO|nr:thiol reductant ABC exporter subunit CydD [Sanguibacter suaedae]MBI9114448.1 thiol reductant ABC exporter subunit CydD [Sanguibacter suaedae]
MKPLDPKLLRFARPARGYVVLVALLGATTATLVVAQALLLAACLAPVVSGGVGLADIEEPLRLLAIVVVLRAVVTTVQERYGHRAAARVVDDQREQVVARAAALGPRWAAGGRGMDTVTLVTRGLGDLEPYLVRYLPQLLLAVTVTPATLIVIAGLDWISAVVAAVTIPLVPIFMILVGQLTRSSSERRLVAMQRLGAQVLDLLAGLPTLRAFGRERGPAARVRELGEAYTRTTMRTLRVAFLSGMVLELLTTLSVALVAVGIGMRLVHGDLGLETGLAVLVLAPEVYLPLRQVGAQFHASVDGIAAAQAAFDVLEEEAPQAGRTLAPDLRSAEIRFESVGVAAPGRSLLAPVALSVRLPPGTVLALTGRSGAGKTTAVLALLGLVPPTTGRITVGGQDLADLDPRTWWDQVAWLPQRTTLPPGTLRDALGVVDGSSDDDPALVAALRSTGLDEVLDTLPEGLDTRVGHGGLGLSVGQRQRVALTAALLSPRQLVVLDEPTAHLDTLSEQHVLRSVEALRADGRTVLVVAHRPSLVAVADQVVVVTSAPLPTGPVPARPAVSPSTEARA